MTTLNNFIYVEITTPLLEYDKSVRITSKFFTVTSQNIKDKQNKTKQMKKFNEIIVKMRKNEMKVK
jgi:hypothetical protein